VSSVEVFQFLKRNIGIIIRRLEESGVLSTPSYLDHVFMPSVEVSDAGVELSVRGLLYKVRVVEGSPVYVNVDRPVGGEYTIVYPGSYKVIPRAGSKLYLKAPSGYSSVVSVEVLL